MNEGLKAVGKGFLQLGNYLFVAFLFAPSFIEKREMTFSDVGFGFIFLVFLYALGGFLIFKSTKQANNNKGN
ncbi:hypothetical protein ThvES_00016960 [Thiovulum sp. ES]|nr:hypothetical protein ThvES_00016960 [Thiovulum sp. ES]